MNGGTRRRVRARAVAAREECVRETLVLSLCFPLHWRPAHLANGIGCSRCNAWEPCTHTCTHTHSDCRERKKNGCHVGRGEGGVTALLSSLV